MGVEKVGGRERERRGKGREREKERERDRERYSRGERRCGEESAVRRVVVGGGGEGPAREW